MMGNNDVHPVCENQTLPKQSDGVHLQRLPSNVRETELEGKNGNLNEHDVEERQYQNRERSIIQENEEPSGSDLNRPREASASLRAQTDGNEEIVITNMRVTDAPLGLGRIPVGFFAIVHHSGLEWRTENKRASVDNGIVEWNEQIPIPSDLSATIVFGIYASFELQPMLGCGEQLRKLTTTIEQLLEYNAKALPLFPKDGNDTSPCPFLLLAVSKGKDKYDETSVLRARVVPHPYSPTIESEDELKNATNKGHDALSRYQKCGERRDLERSIEEFENALRLCPTDHPCRAAAQSNLATSKFFYCQIDDPGLSFDIPISLYRDALNTRPAGQLDRPYTLIQLATVHSVRYKLRRQESDATQAEALLREAMNLSPSKSHEREAAVFMLRLHARYKIDDVQMSDSSLPQHDFGDMDTFKLGVHLICQFESSGDIDSLQQAILALEQSVRSSSFWDSRYVGSLANLGVAFLDRYCHLGLLSDLEHAIKRSTNAIEAADLIHHHHPGKPACLNNLGSALQARFERLGKDSDLSDAIIRLRDAVKFTPNQHPDKPGHLSNLANALRTRFQHLGEASDLQDAISRLRDAVELIPDQHPEKPAFLNNLGCILHIRFEHLGDISDLQDAIARHRDAVKFTSNKHLDKAAYSSNLSGALRARFQYLGEISDLQDAIMGYMDANELTPNWHPDKPRHLSNLGSALLTRFQHLGGVSDLQDAITRHKEAIKLAPNQHPEKPAYLNSLGNDLRCRFEHLGEVSDLQNAIEKHREAVELTPNPHLEKPGRLNNLGKALLTCFENLGKVCDLQDAITRFKEAVELTPNQHPEKPFRLNNLGVALHARFKRLGEVGDLQDAIEKHREAVELTPNQHLEKPVRLGNLSHALLTRFECLGGASDLQDAITRFRDAIELTPNQHPEKPVHLNNLGNALRTRFEHLGEISDLQDAIMGHRNAVELTPNQHSEKATYLSNLGNALRTRFEHLGKISDLQDAITRHRDAVELTPDQHPDKPLRLNNLSNALRSRFDCLGEVSDLQDAITRHREVVKLTPDQHPDKPTGLFNLGNALWARFECLGKDSDLEEAISHFSCSALASTGSITIRLRASRQWVLSARRLGHHSLLDAYSAAIGILPQLAWAGLSLTDRYRELVKGAGIVREAAAAALDSGLPETAVEWLEQGRSIVWGDLFQLRSSYDELLQAHPDYAHRLRQLSTELEHAGVAREKSKSLLSEKIQHYVGDAARDSLKIQAEKHHGLAIERNKLLQEIRRFPGFERFLLQKEFSRLRASAHSGPVVILNAAEKRCDALITLVDKEKAVHIPLHDFTLGRSTGLQNALTALLGPFRDVLSEERKGKANLNWQDGKWESILSVLWINVVKPVLEALAKFSTPSDLSRIFWCPTGPFTFLPIHAAGLYGMQYSEWGNKVSDFVISSYIPTLSILAPSQEPEITPRKSVRFLAVSQPASDGQRPLPGVDVESKHIRAVLSNCAPGQVSLMESSTGTVEEVLSLMKQSDWVHFACHGVQDVRDPTDSGLCLADERRLKVSDIVALSRPRGGLAFLSACQTAMGDEILSDEAIHIAAGMLFAGYGGVVGSMWSISDRLAPVVARDVYEQLFQDGVVPDHRNAARALHDAVIRLRSDGESFSGWLPFIHVGL